jgi:hypothetical protein
MTREGLPAGTISKSRNERRIFKLHISPSDLVSPAEPWIGTFFLALTLSAIFQCLAQTPEPFEVRRAEAVFEELPVLNASEILRPEFLSSPHHKIREPVYIYFGANQFTIDSDFSWRQCRSAALRSQSSM